MDRKTGGKTSKCGRVYWTTGCTVPEIIEESGVSQSSVFNYFNDKAGPSVSRQIEAAIARIKLKNQNHDSNGLQQEPELEAAISDRN